MTSMSASERPAERSRSAQLTRWNWIVPVVAIALFAAIPFVSPLRMVQLSALCGVNILLAQSINILTGYTGQISLGQAALYGTGAYTSAVLSSSYGWPFALSVLAGVSSAMVLGAIISIPAGRVREFYLAMVTFGLGLLAVEVMKQWSDVTGGLTGFSRIPSPTLDSLSIGGITLNLVGYFYLVLAVCTIVLWGLRNVIVSHVGRSFVAVRESEIAATTLGIDPGRHKRMAYVLSSGLAGLAGALYAHLVGFVSPAAFGADASIAILVFAVLGGMRTIGGPIIGAILLTFLPDQLHAFSQYQHMIYGLVLLVSFAVLPRGLAGLLPYRTGLITRHTRSQDSALPVPASVPPMPATDEAATAPVLRAEGVRKSFGGVHALKGVDLTVGKGTIHGLIGPNGSGKSTLLNVISGIYTPDDGSVVLDGESIHGRGAVHVARKGVGRTFQHPLVAGDLTVEENIVMGAARHFGSGVLGAMVRSPRNRREEASAVANAVAIQRRVGLEPLRDASAASLPFGRQRMLEVARSLSSAPHLLLLDEPAAGLNDAEMAELASLLRELRDEGVTVVVVDHHMDFLLSLVDAVTVLDSGSVIFAGTPSAVRRDPNVIAAYLGGGLTSNQAAQES